MVRTCFFYKFSNKKLPLQWRIQGGAPGARPPTAQIFLAFMQFLGKFDKIVCWRPPGGLPPPPTGNPGSVPALTELEPSTL